MTGDTSGGEKKFSGPVPGIKNPVLVQSGVLDKKAGNDLLSHTVTHAVPSALEGLTSVFGMGTGVSPPP